jgi:uncharacterized membrane protein
MRTILFFLAMQIAAITYFIASGDKAAASALGNLPMTILVCILGYGVSRLIARTSRAVQSRSH